MKFKIIWEEHGFFAVFDGSFSITEFLYHQNEVIGDPRMSDIKYKIVDFTNADLSKIHLEDAYYTVAAEHKRALGMPWHKVAFIASESHTKGIIEYYKNEMKRLGILWDMKTFASIEEAREWINTQPVAGGDDIC